MKTRQIATFVLGHTRLGVDILLIKEVHRQMTISPIPDAPPHLRGLMNLRGRVVTVIDLDVCLGRPQSETIEDRRLLILKTQAEIQGFVREGRIGSDAALGEDIVGFLIDRMEDVISVSADRILPPPPNLPDIDGSLIRGVIKQDRRLVILIDVTAVLGDVLERAPDAGG